MGGGVRACLTTPRDGRSTAHVRTDRTVVMVNLT